MSLLQARKILGDSTGFEPMASTWALQQSSTNWAMKTHPFGSSPKYWVLTRERNETLCMPYRSNELCPGHQSTFEICTLFPFLIGWHSNIIQNFCCERELSLSCDRVISCSVAQVKLVAVNLEQLTWMLELILTFFFFNFHKLVFSSFVSFIVLFILCYYLIVSYFFKPVVMPFVILHLCWSVNVVYHF